MGLFRLISVLVVVVCSAGLVVPQTRERRITQTPSAIKSNCRVFLNGKLINNPQPTYPSEAKAAGVAGKVEVAVEINEQGEVIGIESVNGDERLTKAAAEAARTAKFSPTLCDGIPAKTLGIISFNFAKIALTAEYFRPSKTEDFADVKETDQFFEAIVYLTENYRVSFGYSDRAFHGEMPLTLGDFAHFLNQTLEMLDARAKLSQKDPQRILLYQPYSLNPVNELEFNPRSPFSGSVKSLTTRYEIVLADSNGYFDGQRPLSRAEVIRIWRGVFGNDALPVNFLSEKDKEKEMSRGDFAIFLKESLDVLSYKILPDTFNR
jgi:TonB family protein